MCGWLGELEKKRKCPKCGTIDYLQTKDENKGMKMAEIRKLLWIKCENCGGSINSHFEKCKRCNSESFHDSKYIIK